MRLKLLVDRGRDLAAAFQRHVAALSSSGIAALGVVDQMKDTGAIQLPASPGRNFWEVLEFRPDGTVLETWKTPDVLGLHPRDVSVFATDSTLTQRAMLAVRNQAVLLKTETCRAVLYADRAVLFPAHKTRATLRIAQQVKSAVGQRSVLEALMAESVRGLEGKGRRLSVVAETVLNDINSNFSNSSGELQRLLPIQRKLTEVQQDVKDLLEALTCIVEDDPGFKELRGAEGGYSRKGDGAGQRSPAMRMAAAILESYEFKLTAVHGYLSELEASMEQTKTVWHMQLDHQRNRVLRVNLLMSIASFAAMSMTVPAAFFGMNLDNRLEAAPGMFMFVVNCSMGTGLLMGGMVYVYYKFGPKRRYKARLRDMRSLRDLLVFHMDDMDDVIQEIKQRGQVTKTEFAQIVRELLELSELLRMEEHMDDFSRTHLQ
ncbi:Magnesium transporter MRS2-4 [Auxenochlorella protothecoides]|uniref:Magnesium transporter MRS2-4 n=1 Tax=Auxenochlorella protothecoides TaxID=3075 RepID=A0A087SSY1_AUXPR|nr:Magnesium transporter MRS2-4 [Auxenochlorella protothecoides]KFM28835.1 Magnesium transporter MRS2-4 [Auxenochlorella protothecoides]